MSTPDENPTPRLGDVIEPEDSALPRRDRTGHAGMPEHLDDDALEAATEEERVDAGLADYAPSEVPPATDPLPEGSSEAADRAQRGLNEDGDEG